MVSVNGKVVQALDIPQSVIQSADFETAILNYEPVKQILYKRVYNTIENIPTTWQECNITPKKIISKVIKPKISCMINVIL